MLRAGAAEAVITPPVGTALAGYSNRAGPATAVHDDLHARALVVTDGSNQAAIVACDLIGIDRRLAARVRQIAHEATGIPAPHIMVSATHTHAGPAGLRPDEDAALFETTSRLIAGALTAAHARLRPAVLKVGAGHVDTVQQNRRDPAWPIDPRLGLLLFDAPDPRDGPIASVLSFACHATVMLGTNLEISADHPGYAIATVKKVLGDAPVLFLNGACANVNPAWIEQRFDEAERIGSIVGAEAARRLQEMRPLGVDQRAWNIRWDELTDRPVTSGDLVSTPRITVVGDLVEAPLRQLEPRDVYDAELRDLAARMKEIPAGGVAARRSIMERITFLQGTRGVATQLRTGERHMLRSEIQAIGFGGGVAVLGLPGEFFVETAQSIREAAGLRHLVISCYTNHHVMYVVPGEAWVQGGYEPGVSVLDETAEERFRSAAVRLLRRLS